VPGSKRDGGGVRLNRLRSVASIPMKSMEVQTTWPIPYPGIKVQASYTVGLFSFRELNVLCWPEGPIRFSLRNFFVFKEQRRRIWKQEGGLGSLIGLKECKLSTHCLRYYSFPLSSFISFHHESLMIPSPTLEAGLRKHPREPLAASVVGIRLLNLYVLSARWYSFQCEQFIVYLLNHPQRFPRVHSVFLLSLLTQGLSLFDPFASDGDSSVVFFLPLSLLL
jgi:hypothetical protein